MPGTRSAPGMVDFTGGTDSRVGEGSEGTEVAATLVLPGFCVNSP